jgi:uncharacterized protein with NAD-binding domain and iron-sulfur cluster
VGRRKILILGGGISALATGIELLEDGGRERHEVTIACMEHHLGGKAASWRHADGRLMEIGFHAIFGYYTALRELLARAGRSTTDPRYFTSNGGEHLVYEPSARALNRFRIPKGPLDLAAVFANVGGSSSGMTALEKVQLTAFGARMAAYFMRHDAEEIDPALDECSFTEFCLSQGLTLGLSQKAWFRYVLDLAFNYPHPGSAFVGLYGFRKLFGYDAAEVLYLNGGLSELIVEPLERRYRALGGQVKLGQKAVLLGLDPTTRSVNSVQLAPMGRVEPPPQSHLRAVESSTDHQEAAPSSSAGEPVAQRAEAAPLRRGDDFDVVVSTLPVDSTRALLRATPDFERAVFDHAFFRNIWQLRTVASISMRVWSPQKLLPPDLTTVIMGAPQPAATIIDYANRLDELRDRPWASVLEFEGQEGLHGALTNAELKRLILEQFAELPFSLMRREWISDALHNRNGWASELRRNAPNHLRYLLMEPGHWKFRPDARNCPYENLVLAGDWLKSSQPTASMEAAVRTGQAAALLAAEA